MAEGKKLNIATSIGSCNSMGRHPDMGLAPARLYRAIDSCWRFMAFSCPGHLSLISLISGARTLILACDMKLL